MFRCPRAAPASPFRLRLFRFATPPNVPRSSQSSSGIRPRRPEPRPAVLAAAAAGTALAACADSVWEPPGDGPGAEDGRPMAALVSETAAFLADVDSLPSWRKVIEGMAEPGCVFHFRRATGSYASKEYGLAYSRKALAKAEAWKALVYNVLVTVSRPAEGGGTEVLPERLAIRAVCAMPDTEWGTEEAKGRTEAILEAHGIKFPGAGKAQASADVRRALAALRRAVGRLAPRPLMAAQACENLACVPITVTVRRPIRCSAGFDYEATTGECVRNTVGGSVSGSGTSGNSGSSGGGNGNTPPAPPPAPDCTDDQIAIANEYNDPIAWPCEKFTHDVLGGGDHGHTTGYLSTSYLSGSAAVLAAVPGSWVNSDWRCPVGNTALPNSSSKSQHVEGNAGDFDAPNFNEDVYDKFEAAAGSGGRTSGYRDPDTGQCRDGGTWCYSTYIHIDW